MKIRSFSVLMGLAVLVGGMESASLRAEDVSFNDLPSIQSEKYRVDPYIKMAIQLNRMGEHDGVQQLLKLAQSAASNGMNSSDIEQRTAVLCRMLFVPTYGTDFERPAFLGGPGFLGGEPLRQDTNSVTKNYVGWPSEPIEIVDGIPFAVVTGYTYEGIWFPFAAEAYVRNCMTTYVWCGFRYSLKSDAEKQRAVKKLIDSTKWRRRLNRPEEDYLMQQIR